MDTTNQRSKANVLKIELLEKELGPVLEIEHRATLFSMTRHMTSGFSALDRYMREQGSEPQNPPFARYPDIDWKRELARGPLAMLRMFLKRWHFFTGFPCSRELPGAGEIRANHLDRRLYVVCLHVGPYKDVGRAYTAMYNFARERGLTIDNWCLEQYLNDPQESGQHKAETVCMIPVR